MTTPIERIRTYHRELTDIRRDLHAHPELSFQESRTSALVADYLKKQGIETHTGIAKTGVVAVIPGKRNGAKGVALRADMDCLPMHELNTFPHKSKNEGRMHACGHDGHTTMLLGAARYLAETRNFAGTAYLVFQPAEEGGGGGEVMVREGQFPGKTLRGLSILRRHLWWRGRYASRSRASSGTAPRPSMSAVPEKKARDARGGRGGYR